MNAHRTRPAEIGSTYISSRPFSLWPEHCDSNSNSAIRYRQMTYVQSILQSIRLVLILTARSSAAMNETGRPFHFSLCIWGNANVWDWGARVVRFPLNATSLPRTSNDPSTAHAIGPLVAYVGRLERVVELHHEHHHHECSAPRFHRFLFS